MDAMEQGKKFISIFINDPGEPDAIVKVLAPIYRQAEAEKDSCREVLWYMLKAAFDQSAAHNWAFEEYLAAVEQGREPSREALEKLASQREGMSRVRTGIRLPRPKYQD